MSFAMPIQNPIPPPYPDFFMLIYLIYIALSLGFWGVIIFALYDIKKVIEEGLKKHE